MTFSGALIAILIWLVALAAGGIPLRLIGLRRELGMYAALLTVCLLLYFSNPKFLGQGNVLDMIRVISMLGIFAIGSAFVIVTGGIDLSVGSLVGLTGVIIAKMSSSAPDCYNLPIGVAIAVAMGVVLLIGLAQGLLITQLNLQPFIVTLGGMLTIRGVSQTIVQGGTLSFGGSPFRDLSDTGLWMINGEALFSWPLLIFLVVIVVGGYLLHFTVFGRYIYAIGGNRDAAAYSGIPVKTVETSTYVISAGLAGVAGICYAAYIGQMSQNVGIAYELYAIAACVLGGCSLRGGEGTVIGVIIGSAMMRVIDNGIIMYQWHYRDATGAMQTYKLDTNKTLIIIGGVILMAVILDQVVHLVQARRRSRGVTPPTVVPPSGFPVVPAENQGSSTPP